MIEKVFGAFGKKGQTLTKLVTGSVKILGRDKDIYKPLLTMFNVKLIRNFLFLLVFYFFLIEKSPSLGIVSVLVLLFYMFIESYVHMRCKAISSWMVYDILRGIDTDVPMAKKELKGQGFAIFLYALIDYVVNHAKENSSNNDKKGGVMSMISSVLIAIFAEVWDLVKNFTLPAIVIDKAGLKEVPSKLKLLKSKAPEALMGILGFDIVGGVLGYAIGVILFPFIALGLAMGYYGQSYLPGGWGISDAETNLSFNLLPIFITVFLSMVITSFINSLVHLVKSSYFTVFYVSLTRPEEVHPELKEHVNHYLDTEGHTEHFDFFSGVGSDSENEEEMGEDDDEEEVAPEVLSLAKVIKKNVTKANKKDVEIAKALIKKGKDKGTVKAALSYYRNNLT